MLADGPAALKTIAAGLPTSHAEQGTALRWLIWGTCLIATGDARLSRAEYDAIRRRERFAFIDTTTMKMSYPLAAGDTTRITFSPDFRWAVASDDAGFRAARVLAP